MEIGELIGGKYRVKEWLGQGGGGQVYLAQNLVLANVWAVKALNRDNPLFLAEMKEAELLKRLSHPMLPRLGDMLEEDGQVFLVMDYIPGLNLTDWLKQKGPVEEDVLLKWTEALLDVLAYLHDQRPEAVIYRDLKPANLIADEGGRLHLVDFGTARLLSGEESGDTLYIGTQGYAAPEQYGGGVSDERTDLYSLGMTLFHLATGLHPVSTDMEKAERLLIKAGISRGFARFIRRLSQKSPDKRPENARAAAAVLPGAGRTGKLGKGGSRGSQMRQSRLTIGVSGIVPGAGATVACLALARFLADKGHSPAIAELNSSGDLKRLEEAFNGAGRLSGQWDNGFKAEGVLYYKACASLYEVPRKNHDILLADMGFIGEETRLKEFNSLDIKLILCPALAWRLAALGEFLDRYCRRDEEGEWFYLLSSAADKNMDNLIKKWYGLKRSLVLPFVANPHELRREEAVRLDRFLKRVWDMAGIPHPF